jgi:hypothetical protein
MKKAMEAAVAGLVMGVAVSAIDTRSGKKGCDL